MSFSSFSLFSFYQQPNTGKQPNPVISGILFSGNAASGTVADFNWYFPYVGTNIISGQVDAENQFQEYNIFADSFGAVLQGSCFPTFSSSFSGEFNSQQDLSLVSGLLYGQVFPLLMDSSSSESSFSGLLTGTKLDSSSQYSNYSGFFSGTRFDAGFCYGVFSGEFTKAGDLDLINSTFSGIISQQKQDNESFSSKSSGRFWPTKFDNSSINYSIIGYAMGTNAPITNCSGQDNFESIGYRIVNVTIEGLP